MNARAFIDGQTAIATVTVDGILDLEDKIEAAQLAVTDLLRNIEDDKQRLAAMKLLAKVPAETLATARQQRTKTPSPVFKASQQPPLDLPTFGPAVHPALIFDENDVTMQGSIVRTLKATGRGLTHSELRDSLQDLEQLKKKWGDGYEQPFYKAVTNVIRRGVVVRHKGMLYAKDVFQALSASGKPLPENKQRALPRSGTAYAIQKMLEAAPDGLTVPTIKAKLLENPEAPISLRKHSQYLGMTLAVMEERGDLVRQGDLYLLPAKAKG